MQERECNYKDELEKNGAIAFVPKGISMWPILKNKRQSVIVVKKKEKLKKYDVALYTRGDKFVLHRVIEPTDFGYVMCGDSQFTLERVEENNVFGVMEGFYHKKEYVECKDEKYIKRVQDWYTHKTKRKIKLKLFYCFIRFRSLGGKILRKLGVRK